MPQIAMGGSFSNLPPNIVEQIMVAERIPVQNMENKKVGINAKLALVNDLDGKMKALKGGVQELFGTKGFKDFALSLSREGIVTGSVNPELAKKGSHTIEVMSLPKNSGTITNGFPDRNETKMGVGYIKFESKEGTKEIYVNDSNSTLDGVAGAINNADIGVQATVINDADAADHPYKIILTGQDYGENGKLEFPTVYLLDGDHDFYFDENREAKNGMVKINGFNVEVNNKKLENLVPGVTLDLLSAEPGREVVVNVTEDYEIIKGKISTFVESINNVLTFIQGQNKMDESTDTTKTLGGSSLIRSIESRMRRLIQGSVFANVGGAGINRLQQLGIEFNRAGTVEFQEDKFDAALKTNPKGVIKFLRGDGKRGSGFVGKVQTIVNESTQNFGILSNRRKGLESRIKRIDKSIENKERLLGRKEQSLRRKFSNLETQMAKLQSQGNALGALGPGI